MPPTPTIGVFDSGFGGLTVLRALLPLIPGARYIYLGDTARLPYGAKSQATIARYAVESARFLAAQGCDLLVVACNTATALALPAITAAIPMPVVGVIEPAVEAVHRHLQDRITLNPKDHVTLNPKEFVTLNSKELVILSAAKDPLFAGPPQPPAVKSILVLATTATVQSHAYRNACTRSGLIATEKACPLLVPLVEEGWIDHTVTREVLRIYLTEALAECNPAAVLLGCTHYPLIATEIQRTLTQLGSTAQIIDSAQATAQAVAAHFSHAKSPADATFTCYATDSIEKFQRLGSHFLGQPIPPVHLLDLGG